jgi:hypothetical protein
LVGMTTIQKNLLPPSSGQVTEAADSSEMSVHIYQTAWHHIPDDIYLHSQHLRTSNFTLFLRTYELTVTGFLLPKMTHDKMT